MSRLQIIAEAGVNHNGDLGRAREMIRVAAEAGADMVKFQAFRADELTSREAATAEYQARNTGVKGQHQLLRDLELPPHEFDRLAEECRRCGIGFLCTAFDVAQLPHFLDLGMTHVKIPSGELTNLPALRFLGSFGRPILLSTGMASLPEVEEAVGTLRQAGSDDITVLHCTSLYPAPAETINLRAMITMREQLGLPIGYSDHSLGDTVALAAAALGASVIEKHFTLDRGLPGPDHTVSLEPDELAAMVRRLRVVAAALGDGIKRPAPGETETAALVRRSWHATRDLQPGSVLTEQDVTLKRPASGLAPKDSPVGRRLAVARSADQPIRQQDISSKS